jgi:hypothetical protein
METFLNTWELKSKFTAASCMETLLNTWELKSKFTVPCYCIHS